MNQIWEIIGSLTVVIGGIAAVGKWIIGNIMSKFEIQITAVESRIEDLRDNITLQVNAETKVLQSELKSFQEILEHKLTALSAKQEVFFRGMEQMSKVQNANTLEISNIKHEFELLKIKDKKESSNTTFSNGNSLN